MEITISTYFITEQGYGVIPNAEQNVTSIITDGKNHDVDIAIKPEIESIKLVNQFRIDVADWIAKRITPCRFNPIFAAYLWTGERYKDGLFAAMYFCKNGNEKPLVASNTTEEKDKELKEFGKILLSLYNKVCNMGLNKYVVKAQENQQYDCLDDDTHMGSFFGIENRD